jgi:hypothetical protein
MMPSSISTTKRKNVPMIYAASNKATSNEETNCLAGPCRLVRHETQITYDNEPDYIVLWCSLKSKAVIDMKECPDGKWKKTASGYPIKTDPQESHNRNNQIESHEQNRSNRTAHIF